MPVYIHVIAALANSLWMLYLGGFLLGVGFSWTTTTMVGYVIDKWFSENKGTIMGAILASNGIGGAIAIQIAGGMIDPNVTGSYRSAYFMISAVLASVMPILLIFFKNEPKTPINKATVLNNSKKSRGVDWSGIELSKASRRFCFWGALICIFASGFILQGTSGIAAMHFKDVGIDYSAVKGLLSIGSLLIALAKFSTGLIYDKLGLRVASSVCTISAIIACRLLAFTTSGTTGFVMACIYTVICQFAMPLETIMLPIYASDLFGHKSYANILGIFVSTNVLGYAAGEPVLNLCYDITGSYAPALIITAIVMCLIFILFQFVITSSHRIRCEVEN